MINKLCHRGGGAVIFKLFVTFAAKSWTAPVEWKPISGAAVRSKDVRMLAMPMNQLDLGVTYFWGSTRARFHSGAPDLKRPAPHL